MSEEIKIKIMDRLTDGLPEKGGRVLALSPDNGDVTMHYRIVPSEMFIKMVDSRYWVDLHSVSIPNNGVDLSFKRPMNEHLELDSIVSFESAFGAKKADTLENVLSAMLTEDFCGDSVGQLENLEGQITKMREVMVKLLFISLKKGNITRYELNCIVDSYSHKLL